MLRYADVGTLAILQVRELWEHAIEFESCLENNVLRAKTKGVHLINRSHASIRIQART